jgi:hypothetical protein
MWDDNLLRAQRRFPECPRARRDAVQDFERCLERLTRYTENTPSVTTFVPESDDSSGLRTGGDF